MKIKQIIQVLVVLFCVSINAQKQDSNKQQATASISIEKLLQQKSNAITITHQHTSSVSGIKHTYLRLPSQAHIPQFYFLLYLNQIHQQQHQ